MLRVLKRTVSMRRFFRASKTYVKTDGQKIIFNFTLKNFVYLNLCIKLKKKIALPKILLFPTEKCYFLHISTKTFEPVHEISNNVVCATSKASDQLAHTRSLIRAFTSRLSIL